MKFNSVQQQHRFVSSFKSRLFNLTLLLIVIALVLMGRLISLQVIHHDKYTTLSQQNLLNTIPLAPSRGLIFDRNGILIARNVPSYSLNIIPAKTKHVSTLIQQLQHWVPISKRDIQHFYRQLHQHHRYDSIPLKLHLTEQQVAQIYVNRYRLPGANIDATLTRQYPLSTPLTPVLGYVGRINATEMNQLDHDNYLNTNFIGKSGIEKYDETQLHGSVGIATVEINANGEIVRTLHQQPPTPGANLHLTIDSKLQQYAYDQLGDNNGAIVAIVPKTGEILALVSKPTFNPNLFSQGISQKNFNDLLKAPSHPLYNRAIRGLFSPGSTIKPFYALAALQHRIIDTQSQIFDPGWFRLPNTKHVYHDWKFNGHGWVNVNKAIIVSCDTFFYQLAVKMGIPLIDSTLSEFGFGQVTHTDISNELPGIVPSPKWKMTHQQHPWYTGDTIITGIGQGSLLVTPLQLATATAILANRGIRVQPHLIHSISLPDHKVEKAVYPRESVFKTSSRNWTDVIHAMQGVISAPHGTAINFGPHNYSVAGKTGTAQVFGKNRDEEYDQTNIPKRLRNNHLFIAFAPVRHPKIAVAVIIEHAGTTDKLTNKIIQFYLNELHQPKLKRGPRNA